MNEKTKKQTIKASTMATPLLSSSNSHSTYGVNEDHQQQTHQDGDSHKNICVRRRRFSDDDNNNISRNGFGGLFSDHTFSAAMMHSVGTLGRDEYVDSKGEIHLISIRKRRRARTIASGTPVFSGENNIPEYGKLQNLFLQKNINKTTIIRTKNQKRSDSDGNVDENENEKEDENDDDDDDFELEDQVEGGSMTAAIFGVIKGTVGPAILYLPKGFQDSGYAVAIPALVVATFAYVYSAHRLLECWKVENIRQQLLAQRMGEIQSLLEHHGNDQYNNNKNDGTDNEKEDTNNSVSPQTPEDPRVAALRGAFKPKLLTYSELSRRAFGSFAFLIEFGIAAMQFGVCLTYLIFVPANLYASCQSLFGGVLVIPKTYFLVGMLLIEIPLTWIQDIRRLTPFNVLATIFIVYGLGSCLLISLSYSYTQKEDTILESMANLPAFQPSWFMFIGTAFFVFEGSITLVVPLQEAVYKKEDRERFPIVNQNVTICIVLFYMFFAMICWASFEDQVQTAMTASLPPGIFSTTVQLAYSIAVILTYPLQAFPALEVVLKNIKNKDDDTNDINNSEIWRRNLFASLLNLTLGVVAVVAIDYLGNVVSLLGSLVGMPIALVYPPLMHNFLVKDSSSTVRYMNYLVSGVGLFATVAASYATITNWNESSHS